MTKKTSAADLDEELFPQLDGNPMSGPGGYTSQSIREAWRRRVREKKSWNETGGHADTTEAAERALVLAARYAKDPAKVASTVISNCLLTQSDEAIVAMTTAYCSVLALLVSGERLDPFLSDKLMDLVKSGDLPYTADISERPRPGHFSSPDALLTHSYMAEAAFDPGIKIEPAWKVSIVSGCPVPSTTSFQRPTIWRRGFMTTLSRRCCTRLTAADRIRRAASSPAHLSGHRSDSPISRNAFLRALRTLQSLSSLPANSENRRKAKIRFHREREGQSQERFILFN